MEGAKETAETAPAVEDRESLFLRLSWAAVAFGILLYLLHYLGGRSLWLDEAMIALNIEHLTLGELSGKLEFDQMAPLGWLYIERAAFELTDNLKYGLRLVSLLAAIGGIVLFRKLAHLVLTPFGGFCATALYAFNTAILRFAAEVKPYVFDAFLAVLIMLAAAMVLRSQRLVGPLVLLGLVGVATALASLPGVYVLAAAGGTVMVKLLIDRRWGRAAAVAAMGVVWLAVFVALLFSVYYPQLANSVLVGEGTTEFFARTGYAPFPPTSAADIAWYAGWAERYFEFLFRREAWFAAVALIGIGAVATLRKAWPIVPLALGPIVVGLIASSLQLFPVFERLTLYSAPGMILLAGAGAGWLATLSRGKVIAPLVLVAVVIAGGGGYIVGNLFKLRPAFAQHELAPALGALRQGMRPEDRLFVANMALPGWLAAREGAGLKDRPFIEGDIPVTSWSCLMKDLATHAQPGRTWVLFVSNDPVEPPAVEDIDPLVRPRGLSARLTQASVNAHVWLYAVDFAPAPAETAGVAVRSPCRAHGANDNFSISPRLRERLAQGG